MTYQIPCTSCFTPITPPERFSESILKFFPSIAGGHHYYDAEKGEYWFHAKVVCASMSLANVSVSLAYHCDDDEKSLEIYEGKATWFVSEAGVCGLAMGAKNEAAINFKRWIKHDLI